MIKHPQHRKRPINMKKVIHTTFLEGQTKNRELTQIRQKTVYLQEGFHNSRVLDINCKKKNKDYNTYTIHTKRRESKRFPNLGGKETNFGSEKPTKRREQ